jgi:hypothetical protein
MTGERKGKRNNNRFRKELESNGRKRKREDKTHKRHHMPVMRDIKL